MDFVRCVFRNNDATEFGGAAAITGTAAPRFVNCRFSTNTAVYGGGGVLNRGDGSPLFVNCLFNKNSALEGGAVLNLSGVAEFTHCTFAKNTASEKKGGGLFDARGLCVLRNSILWDNDAPVIETGQIYNAAMLFETSFPLASVLHTDVEGGFTGTGNIDADPQFVAIFLNNYQLKVGSPCRNAGNNAWLPVDFADLDSDGDTAELLPFDLADQPRVFDSFVDMGAYENQQIPGGQW